MAVSRAVLVVIVVVVSQVECASIGKPEPLDHNHVDSPESTDHLDIQKEDPQEESEPVSLGNQVKSKPDDPGKPPDNSDLNPVSEGVMTNSHTITSQDFAEKTGVANTQDPGTSGVDNEEVSTSAGPDKESSDKLGLGNESGDKVPPTHGDDEAKPTDSVNLGSIPGNANEVDEENNKDTPTTEEESYPSDLKNPLSELESDKDPTSAEEDVNDISFTELSQHISDEIKVYSNEVAIIWEGKKRGASWTLEAGSVLKDYMDKISIAQAANNSDCVKKDLENHASRSKALGGVIDSCRSGLKREDWHKLQETTKSTLNQIKDIDQEVARAVNKLSNEDPEFGTKKGDIESKAKTKLQELDSEALKDKLSRLKDKSIKADEDEYISCLNDKPEKGMIVDTLNDIMRIKNNCVG